MSKPDLGVLSQQIGDEDAKYRIRSGRRVYYLTIPEPPTRLFDIDTLCQPCLLLPKLPKFPDGDWTEMTLTMGTNGQITSRLSYEPLDEISPCWHPRRIDVLSLRRTARYNARTSLVEFEGKQVVCKLSPFPWEIVYLERETLAYEHIAKSAKNALIAPQFSGHLTENGRVIGFLLEKVEGTYARLSDLPLCGAALKTLHTMGLVHVDVNKHNFVVDREKGEARLIDFEHARLFSEEKAQQELENLEAVLNDDSNSGATYQKVDGIEVLVTGPDPVGTPYIFQG